jgi:flagellar hook-associated protein 1 FlgK
MSSALNIGARALNANLSALEVIGHNIANANTAGYSRQTVQMKVAGYQTLGGQYYGKGVQVDTVTRSHDMYLAREARVASSSAAADSERLARLQQLEDLFPTGADGLGAAMNDMLNAWGDVASAPTNLAARNVVIGRGDEMAARLRDTAGQIDTLAGNARQQLGDTVDRINQLATDIGKINQRIVEAQGDRADPNDLLDTRDQLLADLSQHVQISTVGADDGSMSVFIGGGQALVLGQTVASLKLVPDATDASVVHVNFMQGAIGHPLGDSTLGGELGGLVGFVNEDLPDVVNQLGRLALSLGAQMNAQHRLGVDLLGGSGNDFFVAAPDATGLPGPDNTGSAQMHAEVVDATALKASDYQLDFTATGLNITRLSDGTVGSFATVPAEFDGLSFEVDAGAAAVGDSFIVKPYADVARGMEMALASADRLAAASPVQISPALANVGGVSVQSLYPVEASANLSDPVTLTFLADGSFTASGLGPDNPPPDNAGPPASYNHTPGQAMVFNGWSLTLRGTPAPGDSFDITPSVPGTASQNAGNAVGLLALRDRATFDGESLANGYGGIISSLGTTVQGAQFAASFSGAVATSSEAARASVAGVNLDEEAARLLQYQQAYQASAKYLQVAQGIFDTLLQTVS